MEAARILSLSLVLACAHAGAADPVAPSTAQGIAGKSADNTNLNNRDKAGATVTPQDQANRKSDVTLLAAVRRSVMQDKSLSTAAHNIKILVDGTAVTLRGPVNSADERSKVESLVKQVHGVVTIDNQLDVKTH